MRRSAAALMAVLALTAGVAAGCGGDDDSSGSADSGAQPSGSEAPPGAPAGIEEFQACLAEQGVELPDRGSGPPPEGGMSGHTQRAFEACRDELPEGIGPPDNRPGGVPPDFDQNGSPPDTQIQ